MAFFSDVQRQNKRQEAQTETQEAPSEHAMVIPLVDILKYILKDITYTLPSTFILILLQRLQN